MPDKLPKKQPKRGRGGTRERGPKGGTKPKCNTKMRKGAQEDQRKAQKRATQSGTEGQQKEEPQGAGRQREGATAGEKPKKGTAQSRDPPIESQKNHNRVQ